MSDIALPGSIEPAREGGPKLAERIVVCDSSRIDTLLAIPL